MVCNIERQAHTDALPEPAHTPSLFCRRPHDSLTKPAISLTERDHFAALFANNFASALTEAKGEDA
jgi:hypothetical protein